MERLIEFAGNHLFLVTLFISILTLLIWNMYGSAITGATLVEPAEVIRMINHEHAVILDIRSSTDYETGHVLNAINIPDTELNDRLKELGKYQKKPIVVCCANGALTGSIMRVLKTGGFEKVFGMKGGLTAWRNASLPVTREKTG